MDKKKAESRRDFLKTSVAAAGALVATNLKAAPAAPGIKVINPKIDNLRVVCCHDPKMTTGNPKQWNTIADQNEMVDGKQVQDNIDRMAMKLADKPTPKQAWATIFQLPASKAPSDVKVAIKVNCKTRGKVPKINPRLAVLDKLCKSLNDLGIPFGNIILFDADDEEANVLYAEYIGNGLPKDVIVSKRSDALGGFVSTPVPFPWEQNVNCVKDLVDGKIDILLNVSVNKGSHGWTGPATISLKNHYGTYKTANKKFHKLDFMVGINKSDAIIGGNPVRQQLCFIDSLWCCTTGPSDPPNKVLNRLIMGTASPVVDYLIVKKIREPLMEAKHKPEIISRYVTDFGYEESAMPDLIDVDPNMPIPSETDISRSPANIAKGTKLLLELSGAFSNKRRITFNLKSDERPVFVNIYNISGRRIRSLDVPGVVSDGLRAVWDGRDLSGSPVKPGTYIARLMQNGRTMSKKIRVIS